jgi:serine protease Do
MNKKLALTIFISALAGILVGSLIVVPAASAGLLQDLFGKFFPSSTSTNTQNLTGATAEQPETIPYAPTVDYEKAVINAVETASPSVVSIIISKYLPVIEQCPYNPYQDLPPEFQDLFGGGIQFYTQCQKGTKLQEVGGGSGFIVASDGLILTNKHVVEDTKAEYTVLTNDGKKYTAKVLARDPAQDLAIVKINAANLSAVTLGNSDEVKLGQTAIAIGNALGEFRNTVSVGVVSGLARTITAGGLSSGSSETLENVIQTDAAINPGNSGGPLLNLKGEVIGINTAIVSGAQNIGFAIPINRAKKDIQSVIASGTIKIPFLGVRYVLVTQDLAKSNNLPVDYGALLKSDNGSAAVQSDSPAAKAGLKEGDIILEVNGTKIDESHSLAYLVQQHSVGDVITLKVQRGKNVITLTVTLVERPTSF